MWVNERKIVLRLIFNSGPSGGSNPSPGTRAGVAQMVEAAL